MKKTGHFAQCIEQFYSMLRIKTELDIVMLHNVWCYTLVLMAYSTCYR